MDLTEEQIGRYNRHIIIPNIGRTGQKKFLGGKVLVVGAGGLGSPILYYLTAAGVGKIGIVDNDSVDLSNLQRQIVHFTDDLEQPKTQSAVSKLKNLNPDVSFQTYQHRLVPGNAVELFDEYDFVVDGTDNFATKFLINDAAVLTSTPYSHAGVLRLQGQTMTHLPGASCLRCIFPQPPDPQAVPSCRQAGVLGAVAGILGTIQAAETLKYLLGYGELLDNKLLLVNVEKMNFQRVSIKQNSSCPVCSNKASITDLRKVNYEKPVSDL